MNILSIDRISKSYGEKILFNQICFSISEKQRIGLIGVNGTGKSTLLKIIAGLERGEEGEVVHANAFRTQYMPQDPLFDEESTVLENIFAGDSPLMQVFREYEVALHILAEDPTNEQKQARLFVVQQKMDAAHAWEANAQAKSILTRLGIHDFDKQIRTLSGGQRKKVALAGALIQPADLLILDEPTNHLDNETIVWLEQTLTQYQGALLVVTHDRYFLDRVMNRILELDQGKIYSYDGNYRVFLEQKALRIEQEASSEQKRQNLLRRELSWLGRGAKARTTKQKARIQRTEDLQNQGKKVSEDKIDIALGGRRLGKKIMEFDHISKSFHGQMVIQDFSYIVLPRDRIGIVGPNGSGKTTLLQIMTQSLDVDAGVLEIGQTVKIAYYRQQNEQLNPQLRVIDYIKEAAEIVHTSDGQVLTASQMLERFLFSPGLQWSKIDKLSGGEKRRLYLLRTLMGGPNVLLLDEPTNDLDIQTLSILEDYLEQFPGVVCIVSHDRYFLDRTVDHLFVFEGEGKISNFLGDYSALLEQQRNSQMNQTEKEKSGERDKIEKTNSSTEKPKKLSYNEKREWEEIENQIAKLEEKSVKLKEEIVLAGSDFEKVQQLYEEEQSTNEELEKTIERWSELSDKMDQIENNGN